MEKFENENFENEFENWYNAMEPNFKILCEVVEHNLNNVIPADLRTSISSITHRVKSKDSALKKAKTMVMDDNGKFVLKYKDFRHDITDFAGLRIVTYLESSVDLICHIIENKFDLDIENCVDKQTQMKSNEIGYLAKHYIVKLKNREALDGQARKAKDLKCEIQVKTVLQDAWAQIFHDRQYKTIENINSDIRRKTNLIAGTLELVENNIESLVEEYDRNKRVLDIEIWDLLQKDISEESLRDYFLLQMGYDTLPFVNPKKVNEILKQLGFTKIEDINNKINNKFVQKAAKYCKPYLFNLDKFYFLFCAVQDPFRFFDISNCKEIQKYTYDFLKDFISDFDKIILDKNIAII